MCDFRGHRVLLFSQMTRMLDVVQDYLEYRGNTHTHTRYTAVRTITEQPKFTKSWRFSFICHLVCFKNIAEHLL